MQGIQGSCLTRSSGVGTNKRSRLAFGLVQAGSRNWCSNSSLGLAGQLGYGLAS
jgi:hypothetical protein